MLSKLRNRVGGIVLVLATAAMMIGAGRGVVVEVERGVDTGVSRFEFERLGNRVDTLYFLFTAMGLGFGGLELLRKNRGGDSGAKAGGTE